MTPVVRPFTGLHFLGWMVGAFVVVLLVNVGLIYAALSSFSGEVEHGLAPAGLRMMQVLPQNGPDPGWTVSLIQQNDVAVVELGAGAPDDLGVSLDLKRPVSMKSDRTLPVTKIAARRYQAELTDVMPGRWQAVVTLRDPSGAMVALRELVLVRP